MGGSGSRDTSSSSDIKSLRDEVRRRLEQQELLAEENGFLAEQLAAYNDRDVDTIRDRLAEIEEAATDLGHEIEKLLFGGSIAKHTYVSGLSDIDALVFLGDTAGRAPADVLNSFADALRSRLDMSQIREIGVGHMAVTITYTDGSQLQLLPATEQGEHTVIPSQDGTSWRQVRPHKFVEKLSQVNSANGNGVVPAIKLAKALLDKLPAEQKLSGYHVEALAVDAFKAYGGPRDRASMLSHLVEHASSAVLRPTGDITGQSVHIDNSLGEANSSERRAISRSLGEIAKRLEAATNITDYRAIFDG
jgi:hypothetical protein